MVGQPVRHRHRRGHRRHRADRLRAHLAGAGQRHPGRARRRCCWPPRCWCELRVRRRRRGEPPCRRCSCCSGGLGAAFAPEWLRRRDDVPLPRGRRADPDRPTGRTLVLDGLRHSYVDLDDPTHLEFPYVQAMASVIDTAFAAATPLRAYHLGGGGAHRAALPRRARAGHRRAWCRRSTAAWSRPTPSCWAADFADGIEVRVEDGRLGDRRPRADDSLRPGRRRRLRRRQRAVAPDHPRGGREVDAAARPTTGSTSLNLIDHGPLDFARAEVAHDRRGLRRGRAARDARAPWPGGTAATWSSSPRDAPLDLAAVLRRGGRPRLGLGRDHRRRARRLDR